MSAIDADFVAEPLGRRERKKRQTRRALQAAAVALVAERGLGGVTTEAIAAAADVSPRTFFNYFSSKEEAIAEDPDRTEQLCATLAGRPADEPPLRALRAAMVEMAEGLAGSRGESLQRLAVIRSDPQLLAASFAAWGRMERTLVEAVAQRTGLDAQRDVYPALLVAAVTSVTRVAVMRWHAGDGDRGLPAAVGAVIDALEAGLRAPGPRPR